MSVVRHLLHKLAGPVVVLLALCAVFAVSATATTTTSTGTTTVPSPSTATTDPFARVPDVSGTCSDAAIQSGSIYSSPGPGPGFSNFVLANFSSGWVVRPPLSCYYYDNTSQRNRQYAEVSQKVYPGFKGNRYGYIWVGRLQYGSLDKCFSDAYTEVFTIGNATVCPLNYVP
jgi:hypothetical protein